MKELPAGFINGVYHFLSVLSPGEDPSISAGHTNWTSFASSVLSPRAERLMHAAASYCTMLEMLNKQDVAQTGCGHPNSQV